MGLTHSEIHILERRIASVIEKGFLRPPQPTERGFDRADCLQAGHDVAEMLLREYLMDDREEFVGGMNPGKEIADALGNLNRLFSAPKSPFELAITPAVRNAGMGGGLGEETR